jgi:hypothetical protein
LRNKKNKNQEKKKVNIQIEENILRKRKNKLNENIMNKRLNNIQIINLKDIVNQIHNEENIVFGLTNLKIFIQTNYLNNEQIQFFFENIYYRIIDILFEKNSKYILECLIIINELIKQSDKFLFPLTENLFLVKFEELIKTNKRDNIFMNHIIIFLSELLSIRKDYFIINKKISIYEIIIEEIDKEIFRIDLNNFLKFLYYFIFSFPTHYLNKLSKICDWIIKVFLQMSEMERNTYKKYLYKIIVFFSKKNEFIDIFINKGVINIILNLISQKENINDELYLLSFLLDGTIEQKNKILELNNNNTILPFIKELEEINYDNDNLLSLIQCLTSFIHYNSIYSEKYLNNEKFINLIFLSFSKFKSKFIKNEILVMTIYFFENNKELTYEKLKEINFIKILIKYFQNKIKSSFKKEINELIIINSLEIFNYFLQFESNNLEISESKLILDIFNFESNLNTLISNKNDYISNFSRNLYIKYYNQNENYFQRTNNIDMSIDN